jgi:hypothetical protein
MRRIWSEVHKPGGGDIWVALAEAQAAGPVPRNAEQVADFCAPMPNDVDWERARHELERDLRGTTTLGWRSPYLRRGSVRGAAHHPSGVPPHDVRTNAAHPVSCARRWGLIGDHVAGGPEAYAERFEAGGQTPAMAYNHIPPPRPTTWLTS